MTNPFTKIADDPIIQVMAVTADFADVNMEELCASREPWAFLARSAAMWVMRNHMNLKLKDIGDAFGKDYRSVIHSVKRAEEMMKTKPDMAQIRDQIVNQLEVIQ